MPRTVALLDVLGFRSLIETEPLSSIASMYENAIARANNLNRPHHKHPPEIALFPEFKANEPWCSIEVFSDSIILISLDESEASCLKLLLYARLLLITMLAAKLPVRGAVAAGELYYNQQHRVTLGKALTTAYELEQRQEWVGAAIHSSVWEAYPSLLAQLSDPGNGLHYYFREYAVPMKCGHREQLRILNWRFNTVADCGTRKLLENARVDRTPLKFNNTIQYAKDIKESGALYLVEGSVRPVELGTFWIGRNEPPFAHGDDL